MKRVLILFALLLITSFAFADTTPPVTTFSSFQVPNTTDQNITLTCTDDNSGCYRINYIIDNNVWTYNYNPTYIVNNIATEATHNLSWKTPTLVNTHYIKDNQSNSILRVSNKIYQTANIWGTMYSKYKYYYTDGTSEDSNINSTTAQTFQTKDYNVPTNGKDINKIEEYIWADGIYDTQSTMHWKDSNIYYYDKNIQNPTTIIYSGAGSHSIQYFSTDNSDNNETIKTSNFTTYGNGRFYFKDENSGSDLTGVQVNFNGVDYDSGANNYLDFNFQTLNSTNTTYLLTITKTGYSTRYYTTDLNQYSKIDINFALISNTLDSDIPFKVYKTDETTIYSETFVELKDKDTGYTIGKLKTNATGEATFNLRTDDSNYWVIVNNGVYTYSPVTLTILYPKDEETLAQITERWKIEISQNLYAYYPDLNTTKIVYLLPNTALPYNIKIGDMNGNYFQRTYSKLYPGNPLTDTLQPYLVKTTTGLLTTITTKNAITNTNISGITIKIYKFIPGQGRTLVEQVTTDNKGQAISLLVLGAEYDFECYSGTTFIKTYTITATSSTIFIYLQPTTETPETSPSGFAVKYTPTYSGLNKLNVGTQVFTQTGFNNYGVSVTYTSQIIQGTVLSSQSYTGSDANKTFSHTINWVDINNDVPVISRLTITYGGKNYVYQTNYIVNDSFGTNYNLLEGLSTGLRSDAGCEATGICFPLMTIALLLSIGLTIWVAISMGQLSQQTAGIVLLLAMVIFTYLSWIPFELTVACVLILLAFVVNERRN